MGADGRRVLHEALRKRGSVNYCHLEARDEAVAVDPYQSTRAKPTAYSA
tara:strand:+ start:232 stop:378 length:147 start_codon:yes stop_codon:yes gene_type:complete